MPGTVVRQANVLRTDLPALTQRYRLIQHVLQLAHIARPVIAAQAGQRRFAESGQRAADLPTGLIKKVRGQRR